MSPLMGRTPMKIVLSIAKKRSMTDAQTSKSKTCTESAATRLTALPSAAGQARFRAALESANAIIPKTWTTSATISAEQMLRR